MNEYWVAHTSGFMDMRSALGPFATEDEAAAAVARLPTFKRNGFAPTPVKVGDWFAIHRDTPSEDVGDFVMVQGPYPDCARAEAERLESIEEAFDVDCNGHRGFVAQVTKVCPEWRAIFKRAEARA